VLDQGLPTLTGFVKADLDLSASAAGLLVTAFALGKCCSSYGAGAAADRFGERRVLILGGVATGAAVALAAAGPVAAVFVFLAVAGLAASVATPGGGRLVMLAFPPHRRGLALGIRQTAVPVGGLIGAALLPFVAHATSWRWSLCAAGAATVLGVAPLAVLHRRRRDLEVDSEPTSSHGSALNRNIVLLTVWGGVFVTGQFALLAFLALDLRQRTGLALTTGSLLVAVAQGGGICGRIGWGVLSDRLLTYGRKPLLLVLTGFAFATALLLFALPADAPSGVLVAVVVLAGAGLIGFQGLWVTLIVESARPSRIGAATGIATMGVLFAAAAGTPLYGLVADVSGSYRVIWLTLAGALLCSIVPAMMVREVTRAGDEAKTPLD
jgi:predicted MFS family arabinose efflux permease